MRRHRRSHPDLNQRERGATELFMLILLVSMLGFAGLAYDAGMAFNARRAATNAASAAARAGAQEIDENFLYTTGVPRLERSAEGVARSQAEADGFRVINSEVRNFVEVYVKVEATHETTFLQVIGIGSITIDAEAKAMAQSRARS